MAKSKSNKVWKTVAIDKTVYEALKQMAEQEDRSVSGQLAHLVKVARKSCLTTEGGASYLYQPEGLNFNEEE